jgi:D-methionine transport system ATP-binding protein
MGKEPPSSKVIFTLEHVTKVFGDKSSQVTAIDDVSLEIFEGEIFGIVGMSGAGKSTLVRTLNRLEPVTDGRILFNGEDLAELNPRRLREIRHSIGMIFQSFNLLQQKKSIDNVILPMRISKTGTKSEARQRAREMLAVVGLEDKEDAYPGQLSGGQKQRVAIARALSMNPKVLLCDEITSALDPTTTSEILTLLKKINVEMGITIVIITHEMDVVEKICDRVAIMDAGKLAEVGTVEDIFVNPTTETAKKMIYPGEQRLNSFEVSDNRCVRIAFDGQVSSEPLIANLVLETGEKVSILSANTATVGGMGFGQMIIELPEDEDAANRVFAYLQESGVSVSEVERGGNE